MVDITCMYIYKDPLLLGFFSVIVEAVVILVVVLLDTPLPSWIYPFIFYVQVLYNSVSCNGFCDR